MNRVHEAVGRYFRGRARGAGGAGRKRAASGAKFCGAGDATVAVADVLVYRASGEIPAAASGN